MRRFLTVMVLILGMMAACGGGGPETHYTTVGAVCASIGQTIGTRAAQCGLVSWQDETAFETSYMKACCTDAGKCGNTSLLTTTGPVTQNAIDDWVESCDGEVEHEACSSLNQGALPAVCLAGPAH